MSKYNYPKTMRDNDCSQSPFPAQRLFHEMNLKRYNKKRLLKVDGEIQQERPDSSFACFLFLVFVIF
jgi:hypothetical protein